MVQAEANTVSAVVFIGKTLTIVDTAVFELAICFSQGICQPTGGFTYGLLRHELYAH